MEKYVVSIDFIITPDGDPTFRMVYTDKDECHLMMTDKPSLRAAIDRAILSMHE